MVEPTEADLRRLQSAAIKAATERGWLKADDPPLAGCCASVACMVRGMFGGEIIRGRVNGRRHYWNRLDGGKEVDLTACQFGSDGIEPLSIGRPVIRDQERDLVSPRDLLFAADVYQGLCEKETR